MDRCHLYLPLTDSSGAPYSYAEVTLLDEETGQPTTEPVYLKPSNGAPEPFPILFDPSIVDLWTDNPVRVTVQASLPGGASFTRAGVDIAPAPLATLRTTAPLHLGSAERLDGSALLAVSPDGSAAWQVLDQLRFHRHQGDSADSVALGLTTLTDIYAGQTWVGNGAGAAGADQGSGSVALGRNANPKGVDSTAVGAATAAPGSLAAGAAATSGPGSTALGASASAPGTDQVVVGRAATAAADTTDAVALGSEAAATSTVEVVLQNLVRVLEDGTIAIGSGAIPSLTPYGEGPAVVFLPANTVVPSYLGARGDVKLGDSTSDTIGFYGATPAARPTASIAGITTGTPGRTALLSLISALTQLGIIATTG